MYIDKDTERVRSAKYYSVGYNPKINKYLLSVVVTWIAWYERYYEITEEEYNMFGTDEIDILADKLYREGERSSRFLFSDRNEENSGSQLVLREKAGL